MIEKYIRRWRKARVRRLDYVIARCNETIRLVDEDEDPERVANAYALRQASAFKRNAHLSKLPKE